MYIIHINCSITGSRRVIVCIVGLRTFSPISIGIGMGAEMGVRLIHAEAISVLCL